MKPQGYPKPCGGGGSPSIATGSKPVGQKQSNTNKRIPAIINNHRGISGNTAPGI